MENKKRDNNGIEITNEFKRVSEASAKIDISTSVMRNLREMESHDKPFKLNPFRWSFALTLAGLFLIILISFTFFFFQEEYSGNPAKGNNHIKINSVEIS